VISVVMPTYNVARFLREAVESILKQTFEDFEFIVVDGGSTDDTLPIIRSYNDPRIRIEHLGANGNTIHQWFVRSLNHGISSASRLLIARMDADDISLPQRFARQLQVFENQPNLVLLGTGCDYVTERGAVSHRRHNGSLQWATRVGDRITLPGIAHGSAMLRREAALAVGGYREHFVKAEDQDMWFRLAERGGVAVLDEALFGYRINTQSLIGSHPERGDLYAAMAAEFSAERLRTGRDPIMRGESLSKVPTGSARFVRWQALTRNALVASIEGRHVAAISDAALAVLIRPMARSSWKALAIALGGSDVGRFLKRKL
jgi:glycosyltransferase involved in cell wall biosynthesis